jgi:hypothetical protein
VNRAASTERILALSVGALWHGQFSDACRRFCPMAALCEAALQSVKSAKVSTQGLVHDCHESP